MSDLNYVTKRKNVCLNHIMLWKSNPTKHIPNILYSLVVMSFLFCDQISLDAHSCKHSNN